MTKCVVLMMVCVGFMGCDSDGKLKPGPGVKAEPPFKREKLVPIPTPIKKSLITGGWVLSVKRTDLVRAGGSSLYENMRSKCKPPVSKPAAFYNVFSKCIMSSLISALDDLVVRHYYIAHTIDIIGKKLCRSNYDRKFVNWRLSTLFQLRQENLNHIKRMGKLRTHLLPPNNTCLKKDGKFVWGIPPKIK